MLVPTKKGRLPLCVFSLKDAPPAAAPPTSRPKLDTAGSPPETEEGSAAAAPPEKGRDAAPPGPPAAALPPPLPPAGQRDRETASRAALVLSVVVLGWLSKKGRGGRSDGAVNQQKMKMRWYRRQSKGMAR